MGGLRVGRGPGRGRPAAGLGALAAVGLAAALAPGAACGGRSDLDLDVGRAGRSGGGAAGAAGAGGGPAAGAGGGGGAGGGECGTCVEAGAEPSCGDERDACLATASCAALDGCARDERCLDGPDLFNAYACLNRCAAIASGSAQDLERWQAYATCAACAPSCVDACPAARPLCGAGGAGGGAGEGGAGGGGGPGGAGGEGGAAGAGGAANPCGACVLGDGAGACGDELAACQASPACLGLDGCLRAAGCLSEPPDQLPLCALASCGPFFLTPAAFTLWNRYARCALCSAQCFPTCLPWSAGLCLLDVDPASGPLAAPGGAETSSCAAP